MKKHVLTAAVCTLLVTGTAFAEKKTVYISPNNDGVQDTLTVPLQIKENRYVASWAFIIEDEKGNKVREIGNKDKRPTSVGFKSFFKQLVTPKSGVMIPEELVWNGIMDNGEVAPDGTYYYYMTASDDNGNPATTSKFKVIVDNTAPEVEVKQPSQNDKIFGEGAKAHLSIVQSGSVEDEWVATFSDVNGNVVRTVKWTDSAPAKFDWAGTNDLGIPVSDGVYSYKITSTDRAGNTSKPVAVSNIIYSAEKPATNISLVSGKYFSPDGSAAKSASFAVKIPAPDKSKTGNALVEWAVKIYGADGKVYRTFAGTDNPASEITFDGKDDAGSLIPDGSYQARVTAKYLNGYETTPVNSPVFMLDTQSPKAEIDVSARTFGGGSNTSVTFKHTTIKNTGSPITWTGKVNDVSGKTVKEYDFGSLEPQSIAWNGTNQTNERCADGKYFYVLTAKDAAGNSFSKTEEIALDTSKAELFVSASPAAFNSTKTSVKFTPVVKAGSAVVEYSLDVQDKNKKTVWSSKGTSALPQTITWNGLTSEGRAPEGDYVAVLSTKVASGASSSAQSQTFTIDNTAPSAELTVPYTLFSPDGDKHRDTLSVTAKTSKEDKWLITVSDSKNNAVFTKTVHGSVSSFEWNGTDDAGNTVADGTYKVTFAATDAAGNTNSAEIKDVKVDNRETKAYVTVDLDAFSPNGDNVLDTQKFSIRTSLAEGIENWNFAIVNAEGKTVREWTSSDQKNLPAAITWDGLGSDGKVVADNAYTGKLTLNYTKGNLVTVSSGAFISCVNPPELSVKTSPKYFSPDNDGENDDLYIQLKGSSPAGLKNWSFQINDPENGKLFWKTSGKSSITERLIWDGRGSNGELVQSAMDYPYVFMATDELGMTRTVEGKISIDVLVIPVDNVLKMAVPSIIFRSDAADFKTDSEIKGGITAAQKANNERVLKRIAEILNKFKNYSVTIEGHANNVSGTETEETQDTTQYGKALVPLSQERADFVRNYLRKNGVDGSRLKSVGRGGRAPVVSRSDKDNWWKNRRVEFILEK